MHGSAGGAGAKFYRIHPWPSPSQTLQGFLTSFPALQCCLLTAILKYSFPSSSRSPFPAEACETSVIQSDVFQPKGLPLGL